MGFLAWIVVGLLAGWIAGMVTGRKQQGCITKIVVGVIGAFIGGALAQAAGSDEGIGDFGLRSVLIAAVGASAFLFVLSAIEGRQGNRRLP
jgi:uncharacterized membrane protein YeaQ/YmgE (transglycosylase-associated protein family)